MDKIKYLDLAGLTVYDGKIKEWIKSSVVDITDDEIKALFIIPVQLPPNNEIWYTTIDGNVVNPNNTDAFGANIVNNTYEDGKGIITFDGAVTSIGYMAFMYGSSFTSITIPNSVTSIGESAFDTCSMLTSFNIPNGVTRIGNYAFSDCSGLTSISYDGTQEQWNAIPRGTEYKYNVPPTYVQCTDGKILL